MDLAFKIWWFTSLDKVYLKKYLVRPFGQSKNWPSLRRHQAWLMLILQRFTRNNLLKQRRITTWTFQKELNLFNLPHLFLMRTSHLFVLICRKSYGFCFENADEVALVFAEHLEVPTASILFELAQVFPQYKVYLEGTQIKMAKVDFTKKYWKS